MTLHDDAERQNDHLRTRLAQSMRAASMRIEELERQNNAYHSIIEAFDARIVQLRERVDNLQVSSTFWPIFALASALVAFGLTRL